MTILSSFGRETSLVNIIGPQSIFPILFTPSINLLLYLFFCCYHYHYYPVRFILCKQQGRRDWQPLCTRWEKSYLLCVQVQEKQVIFNGASLAEPPTCRSWSPTGSILYLSIFAKGNCRCLHLNLSLCVTN